MSVLLQAAETNGDPVSSIFVFLVSFLVGMIAIRTGARVIIDSGSGWGRAAVTAVIGALAWAVVSIFFGWIPLLGPILMLLAWITVINWVYDGGWVTAVGIGFVAWVVAVALLWLLTTVGLVGADAFGVPT